MSHFPQLHLCTTREQLIAFKSDNPDDVAVWGDLHRFADDLTNPNPNPFSGKIAVSMWRCEKYESPMEAFHHLNTCLPANKVLKLTLNPSKPSTRRAFPWINPAWSNISVESAQNRTTFELFDICTHCYDSGMPFSIDYQQDLRTYRKTITHNPDGTITSTVADSTDLPRLLDKQYQAAFWKRLAAVNTTEGNMYIFLPPGCNNAVEETRVAGIRLEFMFPKERRHIRGKHGWQLVLHYWCEYKNMVVFAKEYAKVGKYQYHLAPPDKRLDIMECTDDRQMPTHSQLPDVIKHSWVCSAKSRWLYHHEAIVDITLALALLLPPYVLLEIVDWIPAIEWYNRVRKIKTIEGVAASINRLGKMPMWQQQQE